MEEFTVNEILNSQRFTGILDECSLEVKNLCKKVAKKCQDKAYSWEDFFSEATLAMWEQFKKDKTPRRIKEYINCGQWAVYHALERINAEKRTCNRITELWSHRYEE